MLIQRNANKALVALLLGLAPVASAADKADIGAANAVIARIVSGVLATQKYVTNTEIKLAEKTDPETGTFGATGSVTVADTAWSKKPSSLSIQIDAHLEKGPKDTSEKAVFEASLTVNTELQELFKKAAAAGAVVILDRNQAKACADLKDDKDNCETLTRLSKTGSLSSIISFLLKQKNIWEKKQLAQIEAKELEIEKAGTDAAKVDELTYELRRLVQDLDTALAASLQVERDAAQGIKAARLHFGDIEFTSGADAKIDFDLYVSTEKVSASIKGTDSSATSSTLLKEQVANVLEQLANLDAETEKMVVEIAEENIAVAELLRKEDWIKEFADVFVQALERKEE